MTSLFLDKLIVKQVCEHPNDEENERSACKLCLNS